MHAFLLSLLVTAQPEAAPFVATNPANERPVGQLVRLTSGLTATLRTKTGEATVPDVISLRRADRAIPGLPTSAHLITTAGDRIAGTVVGGDGQFLRFRPTGAHPKPDTDWKVPLSSAVVLWLTDTRSRTPLDPSRYDWMTDVRNQDVLLFRNGDSARGTIDGLAPNAEVPTFPFRLRPGDLRAIKANELAAVAFNPALSRSRKPKEAYARVVLVDGTRLALTKPTVADGVLAATTLFGEKVQLRVADLVAIDVVEGRAVYLSDLTPKKLEREGFLGVTWPQGVDRSVRGDALRVSTPHGDTTADKGIGTHPRMTLTYDLAGKYRRFETLIGLDPSTPIHANVAVRVLVDGKEQPIAGLAKLSPGKAIEVRLDVENAKELVLMTDFGTAGGVGGDVNWADARLIK